MRFVWLGSMAVILLTFGLFKAGMASAMMDVLQVS